MLVLTQKEGEVLQLGDDIRIYIKRVKGNMVRLCIDAPREVPIVRVPSTPKKKPLNRPLEVGNPPSEDSLGLEFQGPGAGFAAPVSDVSAGPDSDGS